MKHSVRLLFSLLLVLSFEQCKQPSVPIPANTTPTRDDDMALGNPNGAQASESSPNAYLITRATYSLSYNQSTGIANWCSWHLSSAATADRLKRIGYADSFISGQCHLSCLK